MEYNVKKIHQTLAIIAIVLLASCSNTPDASPSENKNNSIETEANETIAENNSDEDLQAPSTEVSNAYSTEMNEETPTPEYTLTPLPDDWKDYPVIPNISAKALEIYYEGIKNGNDPHTFSKIGDCQNITTYFLAPFENPELHSLGDEYSYLQETIDYFPGSFTRESLAVDGGLNVARVLSPFHSDPELCEPNEHPLGCEIRINNPSIAIVSLEENWESRTSEEYEGYLRKVIEYLINEGVMPILATKADNLEGDHSINQTIVKLAAEYQIPVWNFWRAVQDLPNAGLQGDGFHLTMAGPYFDKERNMEAAWPWRNLTALQALESVRLAVLKEQP